MATSKTRGRTRRRNRTTSGLAQSASGPLAQALIKVGRVLDDIGLAYALVGGLAVSARAEPRTTRDVDLAISVADDVEAERVLHSLQSNGYGIVALVEQTKTARLATARLRPSRASSADVIVDLLFASSGIEPEIVKTATAIEILPGLTLRVASVGHLLAMKILARDDRTRPQDWDDIRALLAVARPPDLKSALDSLKLIQARGFGRKRSLVAHWKKALREFGPGLPR